MIFLTYGSENHTITSPCTNNYNCIAWASGCNTDWWEPYGSNYWPPSVPKELTLQAFEMLFKVQGYELCENGELEDGFEKVSIYVKFYDDGTIRPSHVASQLKNGNWSSKLGNLEDIEHHELDSLSGPAYGYPIKYLRRKRS